MQPSKTALANRRILILDDDFIIGAMIAVELEDLGAVALGPFGTVAAAIAAARNTLTLHGAVISQDLAGDCSPLLAEVRRQNAPILFTGSQAKPPEGNATLWLEKPFHPEELERLATTVFGEPGAKPPRPGVSPTPIG